MVNTLTYFDKWIVVGVSGGPDSMALLDMLRLKHKTKIVVVHVNYGLRDSAIRDQQIVEKYCAHYQLSCVCYQAPDLSQGNFQKNARDYRYRVFKEVYDGYQAQSLWIAHHQDDQLETILFQLTSKREPNYLGMKQSSQLYGMKVERPLLNHTKQSLIDYCEQNHIHYGIDESNLQPVYLRNILRQYLSQIQDEDKQALLTYQKVYHRRRQLLVKKAIQFLRKGFDAHRYQQQPQNIRFAILRAFLSQHHLTLTKKHLLEIDEFIFGKTNRSMSISKTQSLILEYGQVAIIETQWQDYSYTLQAYQRLDEPHFKLNQFVGTGLFVTLEDYPLTIRNAREGDAIVMRYGTKKVNRFFIDRKIPSQQRRYWPVIENAKGEVICVAELGCDVNHYHEKYNLYLKRK